MSRPPLPHLVCRSRTPTLLILKINPLLRCSTRCSNPTSMCSGLRHTPIYSRDSYSEPVRHQADLPWSVSHQPVTLAYAAVLKNDQLSAGRAVENLDEVFWVSALEIASRVICRFPPVPESPDHAIENDVEAFVPGHFKAGGHCESARLWRSTRER